MNEKIEIAEKKQVIGGDAERLIRLAERIIDKHTGAGPLSPLKNGHIAEMSFKLNAAKEKHLEAMKFQRFANQAEEERDFILGKDVGSMDPGNCTLKDYLEVVIQTLIDSGYGSKPELAEWGF